MACESEYYAAQSLAGTLQNAVTALNAATSLRVGLEGQLASAVTDEATKQSDKDYWQGQYDAAVQALQQCQTGG